MPQKDPSRTEKATPKRRDKARNEGNVPKGQELSKVVILIAGVIALHFLLKNIGNEILDMYRWIFGSSLTFQITPNSINDLFLLVAGKLARILLPIFFILALVAFLIMRVQVGQLWSTKVFAPKLSKFNPITGVQKLFFSSQTIIRLAKSLLFAVAVGFAPYIVLKSQVNNLLPLFYQDVGGLISYMFNTGSTMVIYALVPMTVIAMADLVYSRWDYEENLKMTKDEVKDERKQQEGDPKVKGEQRKKMFASMARRMLQDVPKADVVITNPTHYAVAIMYNVMEAPAPVVLAKGVDHLAKKIKETAIEHNVPIKEDKPLAQALYKMVEVGDMVPEEMYQAVASILAQLHKFKNRYRTDA